ncbi:hypothetical protein [Aliiglaciecola lipolytica]|uniref:Uncharacterized protein n=1 Tax=Aliiglaciecola lipolytica E3 TaxID=1127673 RepID=K6Y932_9ALTE|nr:hypothetical protein [Aliiglaciecola lipolytica]GAC14712.1 hypothetical protein GLIP_2084 [Aliiglaciecola lipolytica E3]
MIQHTDHLSVWELAHRWHEVDPNLTNPESLPLNIQDTIRFLCKACIRCEISVSNETGIVQKNPNNVVDFELYLDMNLDEDYESLSVEEQEKLEINYEGYIHSYGLRHRKLVEEFDKTYLTRKYDRTVLEKVHIDRLILLKFCSINGVTPPNFWFSQKELEQFQEGGIDEVTKGSRTQSDIDSFWSSLNHKQQARIMTREVAKILWKDDPMLSIVALEKHADIQKYGMSAPYGGKHTIRNWIKDLKPSKS